MRTPATLLVLVTAITAGAAQQPPPAPATPSQPGQVAPAPRMPPRGSDGPGAPAKGTAIIRGTVTAADTGTPLYRVVIMARETSAIAVTSMTSSDRDGKFELRELPAGKYVLRATRAGFVGSQYGQVRFDDPGTLLEVRDGEVVEKTSVAMFRGGVISGRIVDDLGEPMAETQVSALLSRPGVGSSSGLLPVRSVTTDDLGHFRLHSLSPGEYLVSANHRPFSTPTNNLGAAVTDGFAATYYPGTERVADAHLLTVKPGSETSGVTFAMLSTRLARVRGRVIRASGIPASSGSVIVTPAEEGPLGVGQPPAPSGRVAGDGSFQIDAVPPGDYNLTMHMAEAGIIEYGSALLSVSGQNVDHIVITMARGAVARGVIRFDDETTSRPPVERLHVSTISVIRGETRGPIGSSGVKADLTFEMYGLFGRHRLWMPMADPGLFVKAVYHEGLDVTDTGIEFEPERSYDGLEIVLTSKQTTLSGTVTGDRDASVSSASILAFPQDPRLWRLTARAPRTQSVTQDGRYQFAGLLPGDYFVVALPRLDGMRWQQEEFLETIAPHAKRVTLRLSEPVVADLRIVTP